MSKNTLPNLFQNGEEGFVDCTLKVVESKITDGSLVMQLRAMADKEIVGLKVEVSLDIKAGLLGGEVDRTRFVRQGVKFISIGRESDSLIVALKKAYKSDSPNTKMITSETFTAFALMDKDFKVGSGQYKLKIFGRDGNDEQADNYYESFFNVDMQSGFVYWNEKDQQYRRPLIAALSVGGG